MQDTLDWTFLYARCTAWNMKTGTRFCLSWDKWLTDDFRAEDQRMFFFFFVFGLRVGFLR